MDALKDFIAISKNEFNEFVCDIDVKSLKKAAEIIIDAKNNGNRLHITGIGKPAHTSCTVLRRCTAHVGSFLKEM